MKKRNADSQIIRKKEFSCVKKHRWFVIGFHLYIYPSDPPIGDFEALKSWKPQKKGIWETLKFRWHTRVWSYAVYSDKI